jgi:plasmid segregation protein ParM
MDKAYLLAGIDSGSSDVKTSYLTKDGNVEDFSIPSCIAIVKGGPSHLSSGRKDKSIDPTEHIHIHLTSPALSDKEGYFLVGTEAKKDPNPIETDQNTPKYQSMVNIITLLVSEALAALQNDMENEVYIRPSIGLPVNDIKSKHDVQYLIRIKGQHTIKFLDGVYAGKTITIIHEIDESNPALHVHAESTRCTLGLGAVVTNFELEESDMSHMFDESVIISDFGGKTVDIAVIEEDGLNDRFTQTFVDTPDAYFEKLNVDPSLLRKKVGANPYIDQVIDDVNGFITRTVKEAGEEVFEGETFFRNRNELIEKILKPYTKALFDGVQNPTMTYNYFGQPIDVTEVVLPTIESYGEIIYFTNVVARNIARSSEARYNVLTGGGVLLGFKVLKEKQLDAKGNIRYELPKDILAAPYSNSRGYLFSALMDHEDIVYQLKKSSKKKVVK